MKHLLFVLLMISSVTAYAIYPAAPGEIEKYRKDGTLEKRLADARAKGNHRVRPQLAARALQKLEELTSKKGVKIRTLTDDERLDVPLPNWQGMPTTGTNNVLVFLVDFADTLHNAANPVATVSNQIFGAGNALDYPFESLKEFYKRSSYDKLELNGMVAGWYTMPSNREAYTPGPSASDSEQNAANRAILLELIDHYDASVDYSVFDNDGNGSVDYVAVIWSGDDTGWSGFWWGYQWNLFTPITRDGVTFGDFSWQWESQSVQSPRYPAFSPNVLIHETGHALGLPDYYDYDGNVGPDGGLGSMDTMDGGDRMGHNTFSKFMLDWVTPSVVSNGVTNLILRAAAQQPESVIVMPDYDGSTPYDEYFLVENRYKVGNDTDGPGNGLLVWHIDATPNGAGTDFAFDNSYTAHKLLRLMEADGLEEIESGGMGDAGDYFTAGDHFGAFSSPDSKDYAGQHTFVDLSSISASSSNMTATFAVTSQGYPVTLSCDPTNFNITANLGVDPADRSLSIGVLGGTNHNYTITDDAAWLTVSPASGTSSGGYNSHTLSISSSSLTTMVFNATITVTATGALSSPQQIPVTLTVIGNPLLALGQAVNAPQYTWTTGGVSNWEAQVSVHNGDGFAARSGVIADLEHSWVAVDLAGPGTLSFYWAVSCEEGFDFGTFEVDGERKYSISETAVAWASKAVYIGPGTHTAKWLFSRDYSAAAGSNCLYLDQVSFTPDTTDTDGDTIPDWQEVIAGTDTNSADSVFGFSNITVTAIASNAAVIAWQSSSDRTYTLSMSTNLSDGFVTVASSIVATPPENVYTSSIPESGAAFFQITVEVPEPVEIDLLTESFTSRALPAGWAINSLNSIDWIFDNPWLEPNTTGGDGDYAVADGYDVITGCEMITSSIDCSAMSSVFVQFRTDFTKFYSGDSAKVRVSINGGPAQNVWSDPGESYLGPVMETVDISALAAGESNVKISFYFTGPDQYSGWWEIDDLRVYGY